jgi:RES domain
VTVDVHQLWRVGYHEDPLGFVPLELCTYNHRFYDAARRFRTLYLAECAVTCLREVLADFRPNHAARQHHIERYGPEAAADLVSEQITASWRRQNVLAPATLDLDGYIADLTDVATRQQIENDHVALLVEHDLEHLDLREITTGRRVVTQTIAGDLYDGGAAAVMFPSRLDGGNCIALFEGRGSVGIGGDVVLLTDPAPAPLVTVAQEWELGIECT